MLTRHQIRRFVAYHESGHAVVAHALGVRVKRIHLGKWRDPANGSLYRGRVILGPSNAIDGATICLAGEIAEELAGYQYERATSSDREQAFCYLSPYTSLEPVIARRGQAIIDACWPQIRSLAAVLQRRRSLEADDFAGLMHRWRFGPPDRVRIDGDDKTRRLLVYSLIYPEHPSLISEEWVQRTVEGLCPKLTATQIAHLLHYIAARLKATHYGWSLRKDRDSIVGDITLMESLRIAAERCRALALSEPIEVSAKAPTRSGRSRAEELRALAAARRLG